MKALIALTATLIFAGAAAASTPSRDMTQAMKALRYPKAGALKVGCHKSGEQFRCKATYRHHRVRRFYAGWAAQGGWICAGAKATGCKILQHGFVPNSQNAENGSVRFSAELASEGYMAAFKDVPVTYVAPDCVQPTRPSTWSFCYRWVNDTNINVTVHMGHVKTGYITTVTSATY